MNIIKAKVTKDNTLVAVYKDQDENNVTVEGKNIVHKDLKDALNALVPHLAFLCEQKEADGKEFIEDLSDDIYNVMEVSGYSIGGSDEDEGVTLIGKRFLKSKKVLNLSAPFTKFNNENEEYANAFELQQAIEACNYEVEQYLTAKKWSFVQQELPFDESTPSDIIPDATPDVPVTDETAKFLEGVAEKANATLVINGTRIKSRRSSRKKEAVA